MITYGVLAPLMNIPSSADYCHLDVHLAGTRASIDHIMKQCWALDQKLRQGHVIKGQHERL